MYSVENMLCSDAFLSIWKRKILPVIFLFFFFVAAQKAFAGDEYKFINETVSRYAQATGCFTEQPLNPRLITKYEDKENGIENAYIAMPYSDLSCAGGTGTTAATIVVVRDVGGKYHPGYYKVDPALSQPVARQEGLPRSMISIYQKDGQLFATGLEYGDNDPNCCPSIKTVYKGTLHRIETSSSRYDKRMLYTWKFLKWEKGLGAAP